MAISEARRIEILRHVPGEIEYVEALVREGDFGDALLKMVAVARMLTDVLLGLDWDAIRAAEVPEVPVERDKHRP